MAKRKKKKATKPAHSLIVLLLLTLFALVIRLGHGLGRLVFWLIMAAGYGAKKNPLAAVGLCGFFLTFAFVGVNAIFQPSIMMEQDKVVMPIKKPPPPGPGKEKEDELAKIIRASQ